MRLIGGYASPFVRRVGITLHVYGTPFHHDPVDTESRAALEPYSPVGRIPALVLDGGEVLTDSSAIIDYLDEQQGGTALTPREGLARREVLALTALALATGDKYVAVWYEQTGRPGSHIWQPWLDRLTRQVRQGLAALEARMSQDFMQGEQMTQADVTAVAVLDSIRFDMADLAPEGSYPKLSALSKRLSVLPAFARTHPAAVEPA
jgi:glutathione S-transferase